jgi:hypothetical protein
MPVLLLLVRISIYLCLQYWTKMLIGTPLEIYFTQLGTQEIYCICKTWWIIWGRHEILYTEETDYYTYNCMYYFTCIFSYTSYNKNMIIGKNFNKCNSQPWLGCHYFWYLFLWNELGMYVSINKQLASFHNFFSVLPLLCQGKRQRNFLVLDVPVGNVTHYVLSNMLPMSYRLIRPDVTYQLYVSSFS